MTESTNIATLPGTAVAHDNPMASLADPALYGQLKAAAGTLANSQMVPPSYHGNPANVFVALHMAWRLRLDPLVVMQNLTIIHGQPGWSAKFAIGRANASGVFRGPIRFESSGEGKGLAVTARATLRETGEDVRQTVSMKMAEAEGWTKNKKYQTLPELMLSYRAGAFLVRLYCPETLLGLPMAEEREDVAVAAESSPIRVIRADEPPTLETGAPPASDSAPDPDYVDALGPVEGEEDVPQ